MGVAAFRVDCALYVVDPDIILAAQNHLAGVVTWTLSIECDGEIHSAIIQHHSLKEHREFSQKGTIS